MLTMVQSGAGLLGFLAPRFGVGQVAGEGVLQLRLERRVENWAPAGRGDVNMRGDATIAGNPAYMSGVVVEETPDIRRPARDRDLVGDRLVEALQGSFMDSLRCTFGFRRCSQLLARFIGRHVGSLAHRQCHA